MYACFDGLTNQQIPLMKLTREQMEAEERLHLRVLGWCLKQRRRSCHLSQVDLAALAYLSRGEVQHLEHARHGMREGILP